MSTVFNVALLALAGVNMVSAETAARCVPLTEAVTENGLDSLGEAVVQAAFGAGAGDTAAMALAALAAGTEELPEEQKVTIFAPEDAAWPAVLPPDDELLLVLLGHVVEGYYNSTAVTAALAVDPAVGVALPTLAPGTEVTATLVEGAVFVAATGQAPPGAMVVEADIETCVGVIHIIDALLIAGDATAPDAEAPAPTALPPTAVVDPLAPTAAVGTATGGPLGTMTPSAAVDPLPDVDPLTGALVPAGAGVTTAVAPAAAPDPFTVDAVVPAGEDGVSPIGADTDTTRDGDFGEVVSTDTDAAPHMLAGTMFSAVAGAAAFALLV